MEIVSPKKQTETKIDTGIVYNPGVKYNTHSNIEVLRTELSEDYTRIDFIVYASKIYINGGWVRIHDTCFIRPCGTSSKLKMTKAVNIPLAPKQYWFKNKKDFLCYTLYFPPLPKGTQSIDIIEMETSDPSFFNFYGVSVSLIHKQKMQVR